MGWFVETIFYMLDWVEAILRTLFWLVLSFVSIELLSWIGLLFSLYCIAALIYGNQSLIVKPARRLAIASEQRGSFSIFCCTWNVGKCCVIALIVLMS